MPHTTPPPYTPHNPGRRAFLALLASLPAAASATPDGLHDWGAAPDFQGIQQWFNTPALSLAALQGQVVLVDFWTYACINCLRTLPHVNRWADTYRDQGLVVVGVHTPEFAFERSAANVQAAIKRHGVRHPVAMDNGYTSQSAFTAMFKKHFGTTPTAFYQAKVIAA